MRLIELSGTPSEMGAQQGLPIKEPIPCLPPTQKCCGFARMCKLELAKHAPQYLEEVYVLGKEAGWQEDALITLALTAPFDPHKVPEAVCTALAVLPERTSQGRLLIGRNYDYFHDVSKESATIYRTEPEAGHASLGCCDIWVGREDGFNTAGLFVGIAAFFMRWIQPGLTFWFIARLVLEQCATVAEGVELICSLPHAGSWTYLLADAAGNAAVVEPGPDGCAVRYPEDGLLVMTNHAVCPEWAGKESFIPLDSKRRYRRLKSLLGTRQDVDLEMIKSSPGRPFRDGVCPWGTPFQAQVWHAVVVGRYPR